MPTVIAYHHVKDTEHWLASPKRSEFFSANGIDNVRTFVDPQKPEQVALLFDAPDLDALQAALGTPPAAEAMEYDTVLPETIVMLVERSA